MALSIVPYAPHHIQAVKEFNQRLRAGGADQDLVFYEDCTPTFLPKRNGISVYNEFFVAEESGIVRAGYALKHQQFFFEDGEVRSVGYYHHPLSEGVISKAYSTSGVLLLRDALARQPLLYCLGMEGYDKPLPKMLKLLGWSDSLVPFYFRVAHPAAFLRQVEAAREGRWKAFFMDLAASSGLGWLAFKGAQCWKQRNAAGTERYVVEEVAEFDEWANPLWQHAKAGHSMTAVRDAETLRTLYPAVQNHLTRVRLTSGGKVIGWAVVGERRKNPKFGNLRVGSIIDCFAAPENAAAVVRAAASTLDQRGMDLITSNQSHEVWRQAFLNSGFFQGPSSFIFAASRKLSQLLSPFDKKKHRLHFTRADGDGLPRNY
jgi:hypothetical protein